MQINPFAEFRKPDMGMFHYSHYVDETRLYFAYFLRIPTLKVLTDLQSRKALAYIEAEMSDAIISTHRSQEYRREKKRIADLELFFLMKNKMIMIYKMPETGQIENKFLIVLSSILILMKIFLNNGIRF